MSDDIEPRLSCPKYSTVKEVIPIEYGYPGEENE
jgi:hypothetical protein|tara:strand:- start:2238 stop:2339 length:102 start_codon:yes stop_codon:yes gene_type:complete